MKQTMDRSGHGRVASVVVVAAALVALCASAIVAEAAAPPTTKRVGAVQVASLKIPNLSWLAAYGGFVWVKRDDGFVDRIDARTNRSTGRVGRFTGQDDYCQGIGAGGGAVWSCTKSAITRIDPKRMKIVARIPAGKVFDQGRLVFAQGQLWIIGGANGDELRGIDPVGNKLGPPIKLGSTCSDLAQGATRSVWVLCPFSNKLLKVDVKQQRVVGTVSLPEPNAAFATATDVWVDSTSVSSVSTPTRSKRWRGSPASAPG